MIKKGILLLVSFLVIISGCAKPSAMSSMLKEIQEIEIPKEVEVVALGEATHGNVEFHKMKLDVFKHLVENEGFRAFALEADFGGTEVANQYVVNGIGSAREGLEAIGFYIYKTKEMLELLEWMHDYNEKTSDKVYFYGYDMQFYNLSKKGLLEYYQKVNPDKGKQYEDELITLDDEAEIENERLLETKPYLEAILEDLKINEETYKGMTSNKDFAFAQQYATCLLQNIHLQTDPISGNSVRDPYMARNIGWLLDFEKSEGRNRLFVCGHNGHIAKSEQLLKMKSMGVLLSEMYGEKYFAIGTDFHESTFLSKDMATEDKELKNFKVTNTTSELVAALSECKVDIAYLNFSEAMQDEELKNLITSPQYMGMTGATFSKGSQLMLLAYAIELVPVESYDALIYVEKATPTVLLPKLE